MSMNQNKMLFVENIHILAKLYGKKISEVEEGAGISKGYVSRLKKTEEVINIQNDTAERIANVFGCTPEVILYHSLENMGKDDIYYLNFVLKLSKDTQRGKVVWSEVASQEQFLSEEVYRKSPFKYFYGEGQYTDDDGNLIDGYEWTSKFLLNEFDEPLAVETNCVWTCRIDESTQLILVGTELWNSEIEIENDNGWHAELYLHKGERFMPLCASYKKNELSYQLIDLWGRLRRLGEEPQLTDEIREVIDGFMDDKSESNENDGVIDEDYRVIRENEYLENKDEDYVKCYGLIKNAFKRVRNFECRVPINNQYIGFWTIGSGNKKGRFAKVFVQSQGLQIRIRRPLDKELLKVMENTPQKLEFREGIVTYKDSSTITEPMEFAIGVKDCSQIDKILELLMDSYSQVIAD